MADRPTAILMTSDGMPHHAALLGDWTSDLTVLTNGHMLTKADRTDLLSQGIKISEAPVTWFQTGQGALRAIWLAGGTLAYCTVVYLAATPRPVAGFAAALGCAESQSRYGRHLTANEIQATSVAGVFAAADLCRPFFGAVMAAAGGSRAGTGCHQSLLSLAALAGRAAART